MRSKLLVLLLLYAFRSQAQLVIKPGGQFSMKGGIQLTLQNTDLLNNGDLLTGNSKVSFTGNASSTIGGTQSIQFNELELRKTNGSSVVLQKEISVGQRILFTTGFLNLNGFNADLGTTGHLDGEQENARVIGPNGGEVMFTTSLASPAFVNPANLGLFITSNQNLGNLVIKRGHRPQVNSAGGTSILRYYDILPSNNTNLNATLRCMYFDGELNTLNENNLALFRSQDNINWTNLGFDARDAAANFAFQHSGIRSLEFT